jgi:hypothetical protein
MYQEKTTQSASFLTSRKPKGMIRAARRASGVTFAITCHIEQTVQRKVYKIITIMKI